MGAVTVVKSKEPKESWAELLSKARKAPGPPGTWGVRDIMSS